MKKIITLLLLMAASSVHASIMCNDDKRLELLERVNSESNSVSLNCSISLSPTDVITKIIDIRGSSATGITLDCNNALIDATYGIEKKYFSKDIVKIRSLKRENGDWSVPSYVTVKNCRIKGSLRILGLGNNGESEEVRQSSMNENHTENAQTNAPNNVILDNLVIEGSKRVPLYFAPGSHHNTIQNSQVIGESSGVAIYLGAESGHNQIINNTISTNGDRELIAIDGSAHNIIKNNHFSALHNGGIYLYRNCGEGGTARHQTPSYNVIEANYFYYVNYNGPKKAIYVGSRNGKRNYCDDDQDIILPINTSASDNNDNPTDNYFIYNQFLNRDPWNFIEFGSSYDSSNNKKFTYGNIKTTVFRTDAQPKIVNFECQVSGNNSGCYEDAACPAGTVNASVKTVCNLESGSVTDSQYPTWNSMRVTRESDSNQSASECLFNTTTLNTQQNRFVLPSYQQSTTYGCKEYDGNGGDCHIKGEMICL